MSDNPLSPRRQTRLTDDSNQLTSPRFTANPNIDLTRVRRELVELARAGAEWLPEGYNVVVTSGDRPNPRLKGSRHRGGGAIDVQIVGPNNEIIPNEGPAGGGPLYRQLAHGMYNEALRRDPELAAQLAWGGEFESVPSTRNRPGSGLADYMHFDLAGRRGQWRQEGWAQPAAPGAGPTQLAAATPAAPPVPPAPAVPPPVPPGTAPGTAPAPPPAAAPIPPMPVIPDLAGDPRSWPPITNVPPSLQGPVPLVPPQPPPQPPPQQTAAAPAPRARVQPLVQTGAPLLTPQAEAPPAPFAQVPGGGFGTGLRPPSGQIQPTEPTPPSYAVPSEGIPGEPPNQLLSGLSTSPQPQTLDPSQHLPSYQPNPDLAPNLFSGGAVPGAVGQRREEDRQAGGPTDLQRPPAQGGGAGGPSGQGDAQYKRPEEMTTADIIRLAAGMARGAIRGVPVSYDPFAAGKFKADTSFPKSALDYSPIGKLTGGPPGAIGDKVAGIPTRQATAAAAAEPALYRLLGVGRGGIRGSGGGYS